MSQTPIESLKSNFDLANFTETELQEKIDQLTSLRKEDNSLLYLLLDLQDLLTVYRGVDKDEDAQQLQFSKIIDQLEEVNDYYSIDEMMDEVLLINNKKSFFGPKVQVD